MVFTDNISVVSLTPFLAFLIQTSYVLLHISQTLACKRSFFEHKFNSKIWSHGTHIPPPSLITYFFLHSFCYLLSPNLGLTPHGTYNSDAFRAEVTRIDSWPWVNDRLVYQSTYRCCWGCKYPQVSVSNLCRYGLFNCVFRCNFKLIDCGPSLLSMYLWHVM